MKRKGNLYQYISSIENLMLADRKARRGKAGQEGILLHDKSKGCNILTLHNLLMDKKFTTGQYSHFVVKDPKTRIISALNYYPDRIVHHAVMNYLEPIFVAHFTADTYSCIKGRGISACHYKLIHVLKDVPGTKYYLQFDVRQFYPSIKHSILKATLRRKIKDADLLRLLDDIIDSAPGVPIGNYLSQYFANFYMSGFDHFIKETLKVKYYFRYADDGVILAGNKAHLHNLVERIRFYLATELRLEVKPNYKVKPVDDHGIDFIGYVYRHGYVLLRKRLKKNWARAVSKRKNRQSLAAYEGWAKHCNAKNLLKKLSHESIQPAGHQVKEPDRQQNRNFRNHRSSDYSP